MKLAGGRMRGHPADQGQLGAGLAVRLDAAAALQGMVVVSSYLTPLYEAALKDWLRVKRLAHPDNAAPRREVLWISPHAASQLEGFLRFDTNLS